jgi:ABC-2 type transport system ATP-binding protein
MDESDHLSDRISIIDKGQIIITGSSYELKNTLGEDLIYLETSDMSGTIPFLSGMELVKEVRMKSKGLTAMLDGDGTKILPRIIETLSAEGIKVSVVNLKKPSMDDVFVHYTGRELRDEGAEKPSSAITRAGRR